MVIVLQSFQFTVSSCRETFVYRWSLVHVDSGIRGDRRTICKVDILYVSWNTNEYKSWFERLLDERYSWSNSNEMVPSNTVNQSVKYGLHYAASWPDASFSILRKFFWMIFYSVLHSHQYSYVITHFRSETLITIIDSMCSCLTVSLVCIKLIFAWTHHR